nr:hypothetical protein [uncultured Flavobacterium sp.]
MTNQNITTKPQQHQKQKIKDPLIVVFANDDLTANPHLYGMTVEEYREGAAIHSKCFDQLKMIEVCDF